MPDVAIIALVQHCYKLHIYTVYRAYVICLHWIVLIHVANDREWRCHGDHLRRLAVAALTTRSHHDVVPTFYHLQLLNSRFYVQRMNRDKKGKQTKKRKDTNIATYRMLHNLLYGPAQMTLNSPHPHGPPGWSGPCGPSGWICAVRTSGRWGTLARPWIGSEWTEPRSGLPAPSEAPVPCTSRCTGSNPSRLKWKVNGTGSLFMERGFWYFRQDRSKARIPKYNVHG